MFLLINYKSLIFYNQTNFLVFFKKLHAIRNVSAKLIKYLQSSLAEVGAGDEIRTHDFNLGKVALYP